MSESVVSIAGAIADAVRQGISRTVNTQQHCQNAANVTSSGTRQPGTSTPSTLYQHVPTITSGTSQHSAIPSCTQSAPIVLGDFHSDTTGRDTLHQQCFTPNIQERMTLDLRLSRILGTFSVSPNTVRTDLEMSRFHEAPAELHWRKMMLVFWARSNSNLIGLLRK